MDDVLKRRQIDFAYNESVKAWQEQYEVGVRLMRAERDMKCSISKAIRDQKILELTGEGEPHWPGIV